jgi:hypothetical protein
VSQPERFLLLFLAVIAFAVVGTVVVELFADITHVVLCDPDRERISKLVDPAAIPAVSEALEDGKKIDTVLSVLNLLNGRIGAEYGTASERIGWLLVSQSFLAAAFVTTANNSTIGDEGRLLLLQGVIVVGLAMAILVGIGVTLTHHNCERMKKDREFFEEKGARLGIPPTGVPPGHLVHLFGHFATRAIPCVAVATWITAFAMVEHDLIERATPKATKVEITAVPAPAQPPPPPAPPSRSAPKRSPSPAR